MSGSAGKSLKAKILGIVLKDLDRQLDNELGQEMVREAFVGRGHKPTNAFAQDTAKTLSASARQHLPATISTILSKETNQKALKSFDKLLSSRIQKAVKEAVTNTVLARATKPAFDRIWEQTEEKIWPHIKDKLGEQVQAMLAGSHNAGWMSFIDTFRKFGLSDVVKPFDGYTLISKSCGWFAPYKNCVIFQHRHEEVHKDEQGRLHNPDGLAVRYRDGWGVYAIHGVRCPEWLVLTPSEQLDPKKIFEIDNVEVRREFVRKVGAERLLYKLEGKCLDKDGLYELYDIPIGNNRSAKVLKMSNPSVEEVWHTEFVTSECNTVQEALNFRNHLTPDQIDDENGVEWFQQGDVIMRPKGAKKYRSRPTILT